MISERFGASLPAPAATLLVCLECIWRAIHENPFASQKFLSPVLTCFVRFLFTPFFMWFLLCTWGTFNGIPNLNVKKTNEKIDRLHIIGDKWYDNLLMIIIGANTYVPILSNWCYKGKSVKVCKRDKKSKIKFYKILCLKFLINSSLKNLKKCI